MADFAAAGSHDAFHFAGGERGEVVVEHEFFGVFVAEAVDDLFVFTGAEGDGGENLGLAALEESGAMGAGEKADHAHEWAHGFVIATIGAFAAEDQFADEFFFNDGNGECDVEGVVQGLLGFGVEGEEFSLDLFLDGFDGVVAFLLFDGLLGGHDFFAVFVLDGVRRVRRWACWFCRTWACRLSSAVP